MTDKWKTLRECCLFENMGDSEFEDFVGKYSEKLLCRKFQTGETVFHASDPAKQMAVILSGRI